MSENREHSPAHARLLAAVLAERFPHPDDLEEEFRTPVPERPRARERRDALLWDDSEISTRMRRGVLQQMPVVADDLAGRRGVA